MANGSLRRVLIIAKGELKRGRGQMDRKSLVAMAAVALVGLLLAPALTSQTLDFDHGLYRAAVEPSHPILPALLSAPAFTVTVTSDAVGALSRGEADLVVVGKHIGAARGDKGQAALAALKDATRSYTFRLMALEEDEDAAFPVRVTLRYEEAKPAPRTAGGAPTPMPAPSTPTQEPAGGVSGGGSGGASGGEAPPVAPGTAPPTGFSLLPPAERTDVPSSLMPPFPFRSLILSYFFLIPLNFVVQSYASSMIAERLGRRGEAMLASPARPWEIVAGKTLPYLAAMIAVAALVAWAVGGTVASVAAILPIALAFLGFEFMAALMARSFRELTFLTVFVSVILTIYCFLPAVFTDIHPVSLISPITLVVFDLKGTVATPIEYLYATAPLMLVSAVLFILGTALWREEDLFHQKPVPSKALDAIARQVSRPLSGAKLALLLIPFVFAAELLLVAFLFAWPVGPPLPLVLLMVSLVEETFKGVPSYAAWRANALGSNKRVILFGALTGAGFFLAEKIVILASLVGLMDVNAGSAVFLDTPLPYHPAILFMLPLVLHVATATMSAYGATKGKRGFLIGMGAAIAVHTIYNASMIALARGSIA
ncbi:MAG TPA: PrsW family intramembrane metalloprotease [Candidatus Thermoplasmatota archaeon]|nr:PrsW family intramembrane metalloprotease [Candidatus Thermoplasmatota archaeon]